MKYRKLLESGLTRTGSAVANTPIASIPGAKWAYNTLSDIIEPDRLTWTQYCGIPICVNPNQSVEHQIYYEGSYEQYVRECIESNVETGMLAVDIGAHIGTHTIPLHQAVGSSGKVIAFEPNSTHLTKLSKTIERNDIKNIELIDSAVSNEAKEMTLYENESNKGNSTIQPHPNFTYDEAEIIDVIDMSNFIEERDLDKIDFLKIDVEGNELEIIKGLDKQLSLISTAVIEIHGRHIDRESIQDMYNYLNKYGSFRFLNSDPVSAEEHVGQDLNVVWESS